MELSGKQKFKKAVIYFLIITAADLLQNVAGLFPEINGARCFLILPVTIILAMGESVFSASMLGLLAGLLWDLSSSVHLGFNCIFITVVCCAAAMLTSFIIRDTFITCIITAAAVTVLYCVFYWLCFIIIKGVEGAQSTIFTFYAPCAVYTIILSLVLWLILTPLKQHLNNTKSN